MLTKEASLEVKMLLRSVSCALFIALTWASTASGHHSPAMYEPTERMTLTGTVENLQWSNPHVWIYLIVEDEQGQPSNWVLEGGAPGTLIRQGWPMGNPKAGDEITVIFRPLKSDARGGLIREVTFADGSEFIYTPDPGRPRP
jgi:hypothetical protein